MDWLGFNELWSVDSISGLKDNWGWGFNNSVLWWVDDAVGWVLWGPDLS
jgi:hypothetical protein